MQRKNMPVGNVFMGSLFLLLTGIVTIAQTPGPMTIQATAMGTSTQLGRIVDVNIYIENYSTQEDRNTLIHAFKTRKQDGLVDALQKMKAKGRVRFSNGGVGNEVKYIIELPPKKGENGRRLRLITDRWLLFAIELNLDADGKGTGTVLPACKLTVNKKSKQVEVETYQNPWNLTNFIIHKD
jgi:hypothetical protein